MNDETPKAPLQKKLTLNKETIRILSEREMQDINAGVGTFGCHTASGCGGPSSPPATCPPP